MEYVLKPLDSDESFVQVPAAMNSQTTYDLADWWIQDCQKDHTKCHQHSAGTRRLPTRLVDLGPDGDKVQPRIQLSSSLDISTFYMTLSHHWRAKMPMLLTENLESWMEELPVSILTQTFKDAMEVAKRLKIRYIWIDSLCIIQNSKADWGNEAALMGDWYLNSYCNIIVNARGRDGLFPTRNAFDSSPCLVKSAFDPYNTIYRCYPYYLWENNVDSGMMFDRGWFVQEHVLPPRALYFCETSLFWECPTRTAVESVPTSNSMTNDSKPTINFDNADRNYETWKKLLARYSRTNLTFGSDKLVALSGLAKKVGIRGDYLAGLWKDYMDLELLWSLMPEGRRTERYRASSWSWASVDGPVLTSPTSWRRDLTMVAQVLEAKVDLIRDDPMGEVKGGTLRLSCCLAIITGIPASMGRKSLYKAEHIRDAFFNLDIAQDSSKLDFHLALILLRPVADGAYTGPAVVGLLLEPTGRKGEFVRRGRFTGHILKDAEANPEKFQTWVEAFQNSESKLNFLRRAGDVDPVLGLPRYEITIV
ncbi:hypothetical protein GALMADRAFT_227425 [Galerina marginata CBS 339.88]|uniref:Heterokaryon incompatibility domain-containing protein n=1 Tax=Galerina marginata (strain CBS 339.88) TaxID=685588 RepID=A0A067STU5_GALM3|nr:hypothetical protein GALMADRAFT_227425 [Galerina marginata CBS 339.88]